MPNPSDITRTTPNKASHMLSSSVCQGVWIGQRGRAAPGSCAFRAIHRLSLTKPHLNRAIFVKKPPMTGAAYRCMMVRPPAHEPGPPGGGYGADLQSGHGRGRAGRARRAAAAY